MPDWTIHDETVRVPIIQVQISEVDIGWSMRSAEGADPSPPCGCL